MGKQAAPKQNQAVLTIDPEIHADFKTECSKNSSSMKNIVSGMAKLFTYDADFQKQVLKRLSVKNGEKVGSK